MFIRKTTHGYYDNSGQQHSGRGQYLMLFSWNEFKAMDELRAGCLQCQCAQKAVKFWRHHAHTYAYAVYGHGTGDMTQISDWRAFMNRVYSMPDHCPEHNDYKVAGPTYPNGRGKLWGIVRTVALHELGHWMMGTINIGGKRLTVSGEVGCDGLPDDLQDLPAKCRAKLTELPEDIAETFWKDDTGWNDVGVSRETLRQWALETFK